VVSVSHKCVEVCEFDLGFGSCDLDTNASLDFSVLLAWRALTSVNPLSVEINLLLNQRQGMLPLCNFLLYDFFVLCQCLPRGLQSGAALLRQSCEVSELRDRHATLPQSVHQFHPAYMPLAIYPSPASIARHAGQQALRFVPANGMNAVA
jgi:hypothetical protein